MRIERSNNVDNERWLQFVESHPDASIYHHPLWVKSLVETYGYQPVYYLATDDEGRIQAGIPFLLVKGIFGRKKLISLPFSDMCRLLSLNKDAEQLLLAEVLRDAQHDNIDMVEIRSAIENPHFIQSVDQKLSVLPLDDDYERVFSKFHAKSVRWGINKASKSNLTIEFGTDKQKVDKFRALNGGTKKKHGKFPQPVHWFEAIRRNLFENRMGFIVVACYQDKPIAASVFLKHRDTVYHKYNASNDQYLEFQPNNLVLWEAIKWGCLNGYKRFDLGKSDSYHESLLAFKRRWGSEEFDLPFSYYPSVQNIAVDLDTGIRYRVARKIFQVLPVTISQRIGNVLYKYFG
jgi:hypothetical protein